MSFKQELKELSERLKALYPEVIVVTIKGGIPDYSAPQHRFRIPGFLVQVTGGLPTIPFDAPDAGSDMPDTPDPEQRACPEPIEGEQVLA